MFFKFLVSVLAVLIRVDVMKLDSIMILLKIPVVITIILVKMAMNIQLLSILLFFHIFLVSNSKILKSKNIFIDS